MCTQSHSADDFWIRKKRFFKIHFKRYLSIWPYKNAQSRVCQIEFFHTAKNHKKKLNLVHSSKSHARISLRAIEFFC